jgi:hypothetical protein
MPRTCAREVTRRGRGCDEARASARRRRDETRDEAATRFAVKTVGRYEKLPGAMKRLAQLEKLRPITTPKVSREALKALGPI